jgi:endoplasmic reticulum junction formation protein lunapark
MLSTYRLYQYLAPQRPLPSPRRQWYDKLADVLLGDDGLEKSENFPASSRYALICRNCFTHNGLVKESMWEEAREF